MAGYKYTGRTPVNAGDPVTYIDEDEVEHKCYVKDVLATQMVLGVKRKPEYHHFVFYADEGVTWRRLKPRG